MKSNYPVSILLLISVYLFSACVKDEPGLSDYFQNYLDSIAIVDTTAVSIEKPCEVEENNFDYYTYHEEFTSFGCENNDPYYFHITASNPGDDIYLELIFRDKPTPGKYVTTYESSPFINEVVINYSTNISSLEAHGDDTVYVEKLSGGDYYITLCNVRIENGFGGYYSDGNITLSLDDCD